MQTLCEFQICSKEITSLEKYDPIKIINSTRSDESLKIKITEHSSIKPYEAVLDLSEPAREEQLDSKQNLADPQHDEKESSNPTSVTSWKRNRDDFKPQSTDERSDIPCEEENFACILPVPIANKLAEFGTIEPETMEYLQEKFAHLQNRVPQSELERVAEDKSVNSLRDAAGHAKEQMKPRRKEPARATRAKEQIEVIQDEIEHTYYSELWRY